MDGTDKKILEILQKSARTTNVQLAEAVNLSPPAVIERVRKLKEKGVIREYVTLLDEASVGKGTQVFVAVSLELHEPKTIERFTRKVGDCSAILECYHIAGEYDYLLKVLASDIAEYENLLLHTLTRLPGVRQVRTLFVLSMIKRETEISLDNLPLQTNQVNNGSARESRQANRNSISKKRNKKKGKEKS